MAANVDAWRTVCVFSPGLGEITLAATSAKASEYFSECDSHVDR